MTGLRSTTESESENIALLLLLNMRPAFDTVEYDFLLNNLAQCYGISENVYDWILSYIKYYSHHESSTFTRIYLKKGIPRVPVLGPVLFLHYKRKTYHIIDQYKLQGYNRNVQRTTKSTKAVNQTL